LSHNHEDHVGGLQGFLKANDINKRAERIEK